ncbi:MAG: hypothetical protein J5594_03230 [Elusimicrobiaceae bacterium]|nr:hypothetical protein [Elusimicrobiaceae bacterium]
MKGRTELFLQNSFTMAMQQIVAMVSAFIIPRVLLTVYGSEINGFIVSVTQFISYFVLVEAGISGASIYALYKPLADNDIPAINGILSAAKKFYQTSGYIFLTLVCLLAILYPVFAKTLQLTAWQIALVVFSLGVKGVLDFFTLSKYRVLLTASQRSYVISCAQIVYWLLNILIVWGLAKLGFSIVTVEVAVVLSVFVRSFMLYYYTIRHFPFVDYSVSPNKKSIKERWNVLYLEVLGSVHSALPIVLATIFTSLIEVSIFSIYNLVLMGIESIFGIFGAGLGASFGDVIARKQRRVLKESTQQFEQFYYMLITIVYSAALLLILPFIQIYTRNITDANYLLPALGFVCVLKGLLHNLKTPQGMLVISAGMYRQTRWQSTTQALIATIGGAIGAYFWGLYGIVGGAILANIYRDIDLLFFIPKHVTKLSYVRTLRHIIPVFITFGLTSLIWFKYPLYINSVFDWMVYAIGIVLLLIMWTTSLNYIIDSKNMLQLFGRIKKLVLRKLT